MSASSMARDWNTMDTEAFRVEVRAFFQQHYPEHLRYPKRRLRWDEIRPWTLKLAAHGWLAPSWPARHGGMGLAPDKLIAFIEEQLRPVQRFSKDPMATRLLPSRRASRNSPAAGAGEGWTGQIRTVWRRRRTIS